MRAIADKIIKGIIRNKVLRIIVLGYCCIESIFAAIYAILCAFEPAYTEVIDRLLDACFAPYEYVRNFLFILLFIIACFVFLYGPIYFIFTYAEIQRKENPRGKEHKFIKCLKVLQVVSILLAVYVCLKT